MNKRKNDDRERELVTSDRTPVYFIMYYYYELFLDLEKHIGSSQLFEDHRILL